MSSIYCLNWHIFFSKITQQNESVDDFLTGIGGKPFKKINNSGFRKYLLTSFNENGLSVLYFRFVLVCIISFHSYLHLRSESREFSSIIFFIYISHFSSIQKIVFLFTEKWTHFRVNERFAYESFAMFKLSSSIFSEC